MDEALAIGNNADESWGEKCEMKEASHKIIFLMYIRFKSRQN